jgi:hypothetical protein
MIKKMNSRPFIRNEMSHFLARIHYRLKKLKPGYIHHKLLFRGRILRTPAFTCSDKSNFEVHIITSEKDFLDAIWCIKTFYYYSHLRPGLVVHSDGSLSDKQIQLVHEHFIGSKVIKKSTSDEKMSQFLTDYPNLRKFRKRRDFYCALKIFDNLNYSDSKYQLLLDSDILFFKKPTEIIHCIQNNMPFFNSDYQDAYSPSGLNYFKTKGLKILPQINAGLLFIDREFYVSHLDFMNDYFGYIISKKTRENVNWHEQTLHAMLLSMCNAHRLSRHHQISDQPISPLTVSHHFVNNGNRNKMYIDGLKKLRKEGFLGKLSDGI